MISIRHLTFAASFGLAVWAAPAAAQHDNHDGCTICAPQLSIEGAALWRTRDQLPSLGADRTTPLVRARMTASSLIPHVGIFSTMEFTPADGPSPTITAGLSAWLLPQRSVFNVMAGLGFNDERDGVGESNPGAYVVRGWGEVSLRYRAPIHDLTLYGQAGMAFSGSKDVSLQLGLSHPLAPYTLHSGF